MTLLVDAGGTYLRYALAQEKIQEIHKVQSDEISLYALIQKELASYPEIQDICISYAGQVHKGVILAAPNRKGDEGDIKSYFQKKYKKNVYIQNDLSCALLAEAQENKSEDLCAVYVGTGLGLGVMSASHLLHGVSDTATELGHIPYKKAPFVCGCGRDNCIELFASGSALSRWKEYYNLDPKMDLMDLYKSKREDAQEVYHSFEEALLYALGSVITLFNPKTLVLGGGVLEQNRWLFTRLVQQLEHYSFALNLNKCQVIESKLDNAPLRGALQLKGRIDG